MEERKRIYRSNIWIRVRTMLFGLLAAFFLGLAGREYIGGWAAAALGASIFLIVAYVVCFYDDVEISIDSETFVMSRRKKELYRFNLGDIEIFSNYRGKSLSGGCLLTIIPEGEKRIMIDCSTLGKKQFRQMLGVLVGVEESKR